MPPARRPRLLDRLRADFLTGLIVVLPAGLTVMLVLWAVGFVDDKVAPLLPGRLAERHVAGLGLLVFVAATTAVGAVVKGYAGRKVIRIGEGLVAQVPVARAVHLGTKQIVQTAIDKGSTSFRQVCLLEYPDRGTWTPVVLTAPSEGELPRRTGEADLVGVLVPTTPNPITGYLFFAPRRDLIPLDMSVEDAAKLVMSAGLVGPAGVAVKTPDSG